MINEKWKKEILTIPNVLSLIRLAMIPVYMVIYLNAGDNPVYYFVAAAILAVSCLTDLIDGKIARHFNMITHLGKILDPLADKATQLTLIVCLAARYVPLRWLFAFFVVKESFQLIMGSVNLTKGKMLEGALITGKICTTILFVSLILLVLVPTLDEKVILIITIIDAVFMAISFISYILAYFGKNKKVHDIKIDTDKDQDA